MKSYTQKVNILTKFFGIAGYGWFDLTKEEMIEFLTLLDTSNPEKELKTLYERLSKKRLD